MSGTLEVLVYSADGLPYLEPVYGNTPCSPRDPSTTVVRGEDNGLSASMNESEQEASSAQSRDVDDDDDYFVESYKPEGEVSVSTNEEIIDPSLKPVDKEEAAGHKEGWTAEGVVGHNGVEGEEAVRNKFVQDEGAENWPHEPKYCAKLWPTDEEVDRDDSPTSTRLVLSIDNR